MKRFDDHGKKLNYDIDCPTSFSFGHDFLTSELARKERQGYEVSHDQSESNEWKKASSKRSHNYELYAMIVHQGNFSAKGHYYAVVKHKTIANVWLKFDDECVTMIKE